MEKADTRANHVLQAALYYRDMMGWSIIPISADKRPLLSSWKQYQERLPTEDEVRKWWSQWPEAGIALVTGAVSGVVVFDLDAKHNRDPSEFQLPPTVISRTGGGGWHFFFRHPGERVVGTKALFGAGADLQGDGNLAILPPSRHVSGNEYEWTDSPFDSEPAEMPDWLRGSVKKEVRKSIAIIGANEGNRNEMAARVTGLMMKNLSQRDIGPAWEILCGWNTLNRPPLEELELRTTFESILGKESMQTVADTARGTDLKDLMSKMFPEIPWLVEGIVQESTIFMCYGAPNSFKSFLLLDMAISIAAGTPWLGKFATKQGSVLIVNEEDVERNLYDRFKLLTDCTDLPIRIHVEKEFKVDQDGVTERILNEAMEMGACIVLFDSFRAVHGQDENPSQPMQMVMDQFRKFNKEGISVALSHHVRKGMFGGSGTAQEEIRGSTAIAAALYGAISLDPKVQDEVQKIVVRMTKLKGARKIDPFIITVEEGDHIKFHYEGSYNAGEFAEEKAKEELRGIRTDMWLSVDELVAAVASGKTVVKKAVKQMVSDGEMIWKTRKDVHKLGYQTGPPKDGESGRAYLYRLATDAESTGHEPLLPTASMFLIK